MNNCKRCQELERELKKYQGEFKLIEEEIIPIMQRRINQIIIENFKLKKELREREYANSVCMVQEDENY